MGVAYIRASRMEGSSSNFSAGGFRARHRQAGWKDGKMRVGPPRLPLTPSGRRARWGVLGVAGLMTLVVYGVMPKGLKLCLWHGVTGLPCLFCGMTRASHCFLHGDWAGAVYYNGLIFPFALGAMVFFTLLLGELATGRAWVFWRGLWAVGRRAWVVPVAVILILWVWHVRGALETPKPELLNPSAHAYSWFSKLAGRPPAQPETTHD
jgi:hypothetical protein